MGARWVSSLCCMLLACAADESIQTGNKATDVPVDALQVEGLLYVPIQLSGQPGPLMLIDTGSPEVVLDPSAASDAEVQQGRLELVEALGASLRDLPFRAEPYGSSASSEIRGVLGCSIFCQGVLDMDYERSAVALRSQAPVDLDIEQSVDFTPLGAVSGAPASRILVDVDVEGTMTRMLVDTGAQLVVLRQDIKELVVTDGREETPVELGGLVGSSTGTFYGIGEISVGAAETELIGALSAAQLDEQLSILSQTVGSDVQGILGASFLSRFHVVIDYPSGRLHFAH